MALKTAKEVAAEKAAGLTQPEPFVLPDPKDLPPGDKVMVTRMVFEALAARAGVDVRWQDGQPMMSQDPDWMLGLPPEMRTMEKRVRQLEQENARLEERLKSAAHRDDNWRDTMKEVIEQERASERLTAETRAIQSMRDHGITEADQKAAEALTGVTDVVKLRDMLVKPKRPAYTTSAGASASGLSYASASGLSYKGVSLKEEHLIGQMVDDMRRVEA